MIVCLIDGVCLLHDRRHSHVCRTIDERVDDIPHERRKTHERHSYGGGDVHPLLMLDEGACDIIEVTPTARHASFGESRIYRRTRSDLDPLDRSDVALVIDARPWTRVRRRA